MNPRLELLKLLAGQTVSSGIILQIKDRSALVSTSKGSTTCAVITQTNLVVGDTVAIKNGSIVSKLVPDDQIPTFEV